jgi:hypothetical protein
MKPKGMTRLAAGMISCCAAMPAVGAQTNAPKVEIPVKLREGDLMTQVRVNGSEALSFKIDTGFGVTTIHPKVAEQLKLAPNGHMTIVGIAGEERADTYGGLSFDFGGKTYEPRRVASLPSEARRRWRHRDGILGAGFFPRFVVEIDLAHHLMRLHEPKEFTYEGTGEILPLEFKRDTPILDATIVVAGKAALEGRFEIDTGCDDAVCLGHEFVAANQLLDVAKSDNADFKRGVGGAAKIQSGNLTELRLGKLTVEKPSSNYFMEGSPAGVGQAGHIGIGALQSFRMIFDYSRKRLILEAEKP